MDIILKMYEVQSKRYHISPNFAIIARNRLKVTRLEHLATPLVFLPQNQNGLLSAGVWFLETEKSRSVQGLASKGAVAFF